MPPPRYHPVLVMPPWSVVLDLSLPLAQQPLPTTPWAIGRYDEVRAIYDQPLFDGGRTVHVGVDLGGPVGTAVHAFTECTVLHSGINAAKGDYGGTVVTGQRVEGRTLWALYGHLSHHSVHHSPVGRCLSRGQVLGWLGDHDENGGWPPHVHFQLSLRRPPTFDLPGVVSQAERAGALQIYPDPRSVLGPLY
ncbi:MAG: peptidoglycan DD-metalloendopeptidase family protein [Oligoflexia bacterium]|nr:peptidoglycan DD-metalloendopeptidase family protein [Oligoflexia bacterium]